MLLDVVEANQNDGGLEARDQKEPRFFRFMSKPI
jgi:hypothetical protein